jgi:hypothetical protein
MRWTYEWQTLPAAISLDLWHAIGSKSDCAVVRLPRWRCPQDSVDMNQSLEVVLGTGMGVAIGMDLSAKLTKSLLDLFLSACRLHAHYVIQRHWAANAYIWMHPRTSMLLFAESAMNREDVHVYIHTNIYTCIHTYMQSVSYLGVRIDFSTCIQATSCNNLLPSPRNAVASTFQCSSVRHWELSQLSLSFHSFVWLMRWIQLFCFHSNVLLHNSSRVACTSENEHCLLH